jgi:hypothetical protein
MSRRGLAIGIALALLAPTGCRTLAFVLHPPKVMAECPGELVPTGSIEGDFVLRERARYRGQGVDAGLYVVTQKRGDELVMVGFNAFGAKAFTLTQRGTHVEAQNMLGRGLPVPPENVLRDLHRVHFLPSEVGDAALERSQGDAEHRPTTQVVHPTCAYEATWITISRD